MKETLKELKEKGTKVFVNGSEHRGEIVNLTDSVVTIRYTQEKEKDKVKTMQEEFVTFAISQIVSVGTGMQNVNRLIKAATTEDNLGDEDEDM